MIDMQLIDEEDGKKARWKKGVWRHLPTTVSFGATASSFLNGMKTVKTMTMTKP